jgi:hypothetical protein
MADRNGRIVGIRLFAGGAAVRPDTAEDVVAGLDAALGPAEYATLFRLTKTMTLTVGRISESVIRRPVAPIRQSRRPLACASMV